MKEEKITFKNSKCQKLIGVLYTDDSKVKEEGVPLVIFCHGYRSTKETSKTIPLAEKITSNKLCFFAFDFSGRGESDGKFEDTTITNYINDLKCAIDHFSKEYKDIIIIGSSFGGLVVLQQASSDKRIKALALLSPVSCFPYKKTEEYSPEKVKEWKDKGYIYTESIRFGQMKINYGFYADGLRYNDYSVYDTIKIPVLIIHGTKDESVSISFSRNLIKHLKNNKFIELKDADHTYTKEEDFRRAMDEISKFVEEVLK